MLFYKFIPNTNVGWWPSLAGATIVVLLINLNNFLAFLYIKNVTLNESLYGKLAVPLVLTIGLYIFWLILLVGGQITYAIQNANYRSSQLAWGDLNHVARQGIGLLVFTLICRRFRECRVAYTATQLAELVRIPTQILNACLQRLKTLGLVSPVVGEEAKTSHENRFQPARPLDCVTVSDFKHLFEGFGDGPSRELLDSLDPVVRHFHRRLDEATAKAFVDDTLDSLIERLPVDALPAAPENNAIPQDAVAATAPDRAR
jgi:membrane protein